MTETSLRKSPDLPVKVSRSPAPKASDTCSRWLALRAKSLQVRPAPVTVSDAENRPRTFGLWAKQRDHPAVQVVVEFDPQH